MNGEGNGSRDMFFSIDGIILRPFDQSSAIIACLSNIIAPGPSMGQTDKVNTLSLLA